MKIVVFGASGGTGKEVIKQALAAGHTVTAFFRDPARLAMADPALTVVVGDAFDPLAVSEAVAGQDAAVVSLGSRDRNDSTSRSRGTAHVIQAMQEHQVRRLVVVSAGGTGDSYDQLPVMFKAIVKTFLRNTYIDHEQQEKHVQESGLDWVIVRPPGLTDGPVTGEYHVYAPGEKMRSGQISRADVAHFTLAQLTGDRYLGQAITIA